jgi:signal peptidase I
MNGEAPVLNTEPIARADALPASPAESRIRPFLRRAGQYLAVMALAVASYFLISRFVVQSVTIVGVSMVPTLQNSERYLLNRWIFLLRAPRPADIVVIRDPTDNSFAVKRIIAVTGDSVSLERGRVCVNGQELDEPYLAPGTATYASPQLRQEVFKCGKDQYFVLGDNRTYSLDSRAYGPVSRGRILGLVVH